MNLMKRAVPLALCSVLSASCETPLYAPDLVAIYAAALEPVFERAGDSITVVLESETGWPGPDFTDPFFRDIGASRSLVRAHRTVNSASISLDTTVTNALNVDRWTPHARSNPSVVLGALTSAYTDYDAPVVVISVSWPVVSRDGRTALVHYWVGCGALCGDGHVVKLQRQAEGWTVVSDRLYAVS
jgi:hypothetical protein